jgi:hypothetical protein
MTRGDHRNANLSQNQITRKAAIKDLFSCLGQRLEVFAIVCQP